VRALAATTAPPPAEDVARRPAPDVETPGAEARSGHDFAFVQVQALPQLLLRDRPKHTSGGVPHDPARQVSAGIWDTTPCISVISPDQRYAHEREDLSGEDLFSRRCPLRICAGEQVPFEFIFHVDSVEVARPQPFTNPNIAVTVDLDDTRLLEATGEAAYQGPGERLVPSFGLRPALVPRDAGTLYVSAAISAWNEPGEIVEVWHDDEGDYYIHKGRKVRLPEEL
jgi:hypothetical protein